MSESRYMRAALSRPGESERLRTAKPPMAELARAAALRSPSVTPPGSRSQLRWPTAASCACVTSPGSASAPRSSYRTMSARCAPRPRAVPARRQDGHVRADGRRDARWWRLSCRPRRRPCQRERHERDTAVVAPLATGSPEWVRLAKRARLLSWLSLGAMTLEGAIAIIAGVIAGSIALIGFGIDSAIEGLASVVIIWRFAASRRTSETAERRAQQLVAIQFFILAPYITFEAVALADRGDHARTSAGSVSGPRSGVSW